MSGVDPRIPRIPRTSRALIVCRRPCDELGIAGTQGAAVPELTGEPAYRQVANDLRGQITTGVLPAGAQLPSTTALTQKYGVSATVIKAALNELRVDGLIVGQ